MTSKQLDLLDNYIMAVSNYSVARAQSHDTLYIASKYQELSEARIAFSRAMRKES